MRSIVLAPLLGLTASVAAAQDWGGLTALSSAMGANEMAFR